MSLNIAKTNIVHFRRKCKGCTRSKFYLYISRQTIRYASQYKYLGLLFNEHLQGDKPVKAILCKVNRALAILIHKVKHVGASTSGGLSWMRPGIPLPGSPFRIGKETSTPFLATARQVASLNSTEY